MFGFLFSIKNVVLDWSVWWSGESYWCLWGTEKAWQEFQSSVNGKYLWKKTPCLWKTQSLWNCTHSRAPLEPKHSYYKLHFLHWKHLVVWSIASSERKIGYSGKFFSCWDLITTLNHSIFMILLKYKGDLFNLQMVI